MAIYKCDPAGSNTAPYDTWAKAATNPNTIEALFAAGDVMHIRGTFTGITWTWAASGTSPQSANAITVIGCDASGNLYAGQAVINCNSAVASGIVTAGHDYRRTHCITVQNGTGNGINFTVGGSISCLWEKIISEGNTGSGIDCNDLDDGDLWLNCISRNNTLDGWDETQSACFVGCYSHGNGGRGYDANTGVFVHCGAYDNDADNFVLRIGTTNKLISCFADGSSSGSGVRVDTGTYTQIVGCAFTNNATNGIECATDISLEDYNGFLNNTGGDRSNIMTGRNSGTFAASPYVNAGAGNFSTSDTASFRRTEIDMEFA